jgi:hypothetical protein
MTKEDEAQNFPFCPDHVRLETDSAVAATEIKNLVASYNKLYEIVNEVRGIVNGELNKRVPKWVLIIITLLSCLSTGLIVNSLAKGSG